MEIKTLEAQPALSLHLRTSLATIKHDVGTYPEQLIEALQQAHIEATGPMVFVYRNMRMQPDALFDLEIALPVASTKNYSGAAQASTLNTFRYVETVHHGNLQSMSESTYPKFFGELAACDLQLSNESREVYRHFVDPSSADNITLIQAGLRD